MVGLGAEGVAAVADADRAHAQDLEEAAEREHCAGRADTRDQVTDAATAGRLTEGSPLQVEATGHAVQTEADAQQHDDRADTLDARHRRRRR